MQPGQARRVGPDVETVEEALAGAGAQTFAQRWDQLITRAAPRQARLCPPAATNRPDWSGSITSACAPTGVATTASPCASPSSTDIASPSACEGSTRMSAAAHRALAAG